MSCMLCFGRSHYFKYMCPADYQPPPVAPSDDYLPMSRAPALDNPEYYHMATSSEGGGGGGGEPSPPPPLAPPKPPRQPAAEQTFSGEYLYTRLERPPVPPPVARAPPRAAPRPSPYDNVPVGRRGSRPADAAAAAAAAAAVTAAQPAPLTEEELAQRHRQVAEERERTEALDQLEQSRLDEILSMCAEYDSQMAAVPTPAGRPPDSPAPAQRRIKTNGSLPRDKRLGSPGPVTPPEARRRSLSDDEPTAADPAALRSPYENVSFAGYPQSPRTRIRTTLQRERQEAAAAATAREASPPAAGAVYMVPPPPVPVPPPRQPASQNGDERHSLQFENREYMQGLPLDPSFQQDDLIFLPAVGGGYVNTGMDEETCRAAEAASARARLGRQPGGDEPAARLGRPDEAHRVSWRDELDGDEPGRHSRSFSDTTDDEREMCRRLKDQRRMTYRQLSELRQEKLNLEHQESESIRQLEMEHALLEGEVETHLERLQGPLASSCV
ncbi:CASP-like protein 4U1 [Pollicipes pollicipes]|uniref:CASP-like protein 4U1 n=1 Tax=Pollicipes pollicipes TaxID=41117 RepID=UPI0018859F77|nr:CASP-like protein 4U1 [Pollicipes pollicipes]